MQIAWRFRALLIALAVLFQVTTRYVDLQPVGMGARDATLSLSSVLILIFPLGAFGLVWFVVVSTRLSASLKIGPIVPQRTSLQASLSR